MILHPAGCHALSTGNEVEGGADADLHRPQCGVVFVGETSCLGQPRPTNTMPALTPVDPFDKKAIFMGAQSPEHRWLRTDDLQPRKPLDQTFAEPLTVCRGRAVKVDGDAALGGAPAQPDGELRTVDATRSPAR